MPVRCGRGEERAVLHVVWGRSGVVLDVVGLGCDGIGFARANAASIRANFESRRTAHGIEPCAPTRECTVLNLLPEVPRHFARIRHVVCKNQRVDPKIRHVEFRDRRVDFSFRRVESAKNKSNP
jgi:hypothetical protein